MSSKKESYFWTSYADLMTSMFFVMLVLFVLAIALQHKRIKGTQAQLDKIEEIQQATQTIDSTVFVYNTEYKRHTIRNVQVSFATQSAEITDIPLPEREKLLHAGNVIYDFLQKARKGIPEAQYLLIVEGQTSKDSYIENYELSYKRALSLVKYWKRNNVSFDNLPNCELIISGSGCSSTFREQPDNASNKNNQRFVIHIVPKPGIIENTDEK